MSALLERYKRRATVLKPAALGRDPMSDIAELAAGEARHWKALDRELRESGDPVALLGGFAGLEVTPTPVNSPTITLTGTEALLWGGAANTPIAANVQVPKVYRLVAWGLTTTAVTPGTFTLNPRIGTLITSPTVGISVAVTPTASDTTTLWFLRGDLLVRSGGTAAVATGIFNYYQGASTTASGTIAQAQDVIFGGVSATFDSTVASALVVGAIATTSTTNTIIPNAIIWASLN